MTTTAAAMTAELQQQRTSTRITGKGNQAPLPSHDTSPRTTASTSAIAVFHLSWPLTDPCTPSSPQARPSTHSESGWGSNAFHLSLPEFTRKTMYMSINIGVLLPHKRWHVMLVCVHPSFICSYLPRLFSGRMREQ